MLIRKTFDGDFPEVYGIGDKDEALYYCYFAHHIWHGTKGAIDWIKRKKEPGLVKTDEADVGCLLKCFARSDN